MNQTAISWTKKTWNPTSGCSRVSEGCRFCYAEALSLRFGRSQLPWTAKNAPLNVKLHPDRLGQPAKLKEGAEIFVNSMSDLFHEEIPDAYIAEVFAVMEGLPRHTFQVLTKRPERAAAWPGPWPAHVWMGTSVEDARVLHRVDALRRCAAQVRFLSAEPLLGPLSGIDLAGVHWVIAGGESGRHMGGHPERWMDQAWARELRDACTAAGVAFFFKQSSGVRTELGQALQEEDGSLWLWRQKPGRLDPPVHVHEGDSPAYRIPRPPGASLPVLEARPPAARPARQPARA